MIADLSGYPEYKPSGCNWIDEIPAHWDVRRNGRLFSQRKETGFGHLPILEVSLKTGVRVRAFGGSARKQVMSDRDKYKRAVQGDIAYNMMRMWQGAVGVAPTDGLISPAYVVATPHEDVDPAYYAQLFRTDAYKGEVDGFSRGIVKDRNRLYWEDFKQIASCYPPPDEQAAIVRFITAADRRIKRLLNAKRRLIELLNEQKQAVITHAVARGLDPSATTKASGIEWLGEIPKHWEPVRLSRRYEQCLGKMLDSKRITGEYATPYLRNTDVQWGHVRTTDLPSMDIAPSEYDRYTVRPGDLLVCEGGEVGRCAFWEGQIERCGFQKALHRLRPLDPQADSARFLYYVLYTASACGIFKAGGSENTIAHLTGEKLRAHRFAFPPIREQEQIVIELDDACHEIERSRSLAYESIRLITEYRSRLVAEVVTGKLDIRAAAAKLPDLTAEPDARDGLDEDDTLDAVEEELEEEAAHVAD